MNKKYVVLVIVVIIVGIVIWVTGKPKEESNNTENMKELGSTLVCSIAGG